MGVLYHGRQGFTSKWENSDLSRAIARLKGDRSPFNTSPSDLPEIASDFRSGGAAPQIFDLSCQRFSARRKTWKPKGFPTLNLQGNFFLYAPRLSLRSVAGILPLWGSASRTACVLPFGLRLQAQSASRTLSVDRLPLAKIAPFSPRMSPKTIGNRGAPPPIPPVS